MAGFDDKRSPLAKALGERVPVKVVTVERGRLVGIPLALLALSMDESQDATVSAHKHLTEVKQWAEENLFTEDGTTALNMEIATHVLSRALVVPPGKEAVNPAEVQRVVGSSDELRKLLQPDEIQLLWGMYLDHLQERSPLSRARSWEEVEGTLEALGKGQVSTFALSGFDVATLRFIANELAVRLFSMPTSSPSSDTSPSSAKADGSKPTSDSATESPTPATLIVE